jgi:hypothetical protein
MPINRRILSGRQDKAVAKEYKFKKQQVTWHRMHHLPWRSKLAKKPVTCEEQLEFLKYELARLQAWAEAGESVAEALRVVVARRNVLELEMRVQHKLEGTHQRRFGAKPIDPEDFKVTFEGGRPKGVTKQ